LSSFSFRLPASGFQLPALFNAAASLGPQAHQPSAFRLLTSAFCHSAFSIQHSPFSIQHSAFLLLSPNLFALRPRFV
jgi:hypothetical protein